MGIENPFQIQFGNFFFYSIEWIDWSHNQMQVRNLCVKVTPNTQNTQWFSKQNKVKTSYLNLIWWLNTRNIWFWINYVYIRFECVFCRLGIQEVKLVNRSLCAVPDWFSIHDIFTYFRLFSWRTYSTVAEIQKCKKYPKIKSNY